MNRWQRILKLFDRTFFRMAFQFLAIIFVAFFLFVVVGAFSIGA